MSGNLDIEGEERDEDKFGGPHSGLDSLNGSCDIELVPVLLILLAVFVVGTRRGKGKLSLSLSVVAIPLVTKDGSRGEVI